jgi:hypothetical protein
MNLDATLNASLDRMDRSSLLKARRLPIRWAARIDARGVGIHRIEIGEYEIGSLATKSQFFVGV